MCGAVKVYTYFIDGSSVNQVGDGILLAFYLRQCLFGGTVVFELEHVDGIGELHYHVRTSYGTLHFHIHVLPHQAEQQVEDCLVMSLRLVFQVVRNGGEERTGALQATFDVALHQITEERNRVKGAILWKTVDVVRQQGFSEAVTHFAIRISQRIGTEYGIISFDGQIAALVKYGNGVGNGLRRCIELLFHGFGSFQTAYVEIRLLQQFYKECGRSGRKPEVLVLTTV